MREVRKAHAGVTKRLWEMKDVVDMLEAFEVRDHQWVA
jgi:hypothetical protein